MFSSSCFSLSKHNIIVLILKCTCVEFIPSSYHGKIKPKKRKNKKYTNVRKSYSTSRKGIGGRKKTEKISKAKTTTLTYFDNLKKKQQDQGGKNWYYAESLVTKNLKSQN